jgi:predicted DNA-binding ribbon-helix-helix protein
MKEDMSFKDKLVEFYEESKENINFKSQLILSLVQSIKEENNQFFSKSKQIKLIYLKYL